VCGEKNDYQRNLYEVEIDSAFSGSSIHLPFRRIQRRAFQETPEPKAGELIRSLRISNSRVLKQMPPSRSLVGISQPHLRLFRHQNQLTA